MTDKAMNLGGFQQPAGYQPVPQQAPIHPVTAAPNVQYGAAHYYPAQVHATPSTSSSGGCSLLSGGCHSNSNNANWSPDSHPVFMLPENELLDASSSKCGKCLIRAFNRFYRGGFNIMFYFILIVSFLIAPFFGMAVALFELGCHAARVFARPLGKLILDMSGVGIYLNKRTEYMEVRTNILRNKKVAQVEVV